MCNKNIVLFFLHHFQDVQGIFGSIEIVEITTSRLDKDTPTILVQTSLCANNHVFKF